MGRRPKAIVAEFFQRGQKLDDSSNRYEHTCKKCGDHFAKGRIDGMMHHLLKRCPNMTREERELAFLHAQSRPSGPSKAKKQTANNAQRAQHTNTMQPQMMRDARHGLDQQAAPDDLTEHTQQVPQGMRQIREQGLAPDLPLHLLMQRQQSALDTLAEVSRRHLDYSVQKDGYGGESQEAVAFRQSDRAFLEQALIEALDRDNDDSQGTASYNDNEQNDMNMYSNYGPPTQPGAESTSFNNGQTPLPLIQTATAANQQLEESNYDVTDGPIDPQINDEVNNDGATTSPVLAQDLSPQPQADFVPWTEAPQRSVKQPDPPSNEPNPEFSIVQKPDKSNARARFTDSRRKEVQEVRKRGACMRCRMLKKPCSEGTPCGTCKKIDSARLWKGTCFRTKLAEEFTLYSTSYFHSQAVAQVSSAVQGKHSVPLPGRIELKFSSASTLAMTFSTKRCLGSGLSTDHQIFGKAMQHTNTPDDIFVLDDGMASQKVSDYCARDAIVNECIPNEANPFLQATLCEAMDLLEVEKAQEASSKQTSKTRSNHISPSVLLKNVIELWIETSLLVADSNDSLQIRYNPNMLSSQDPQVVTWPDNTSGPSAALPLDPASRSLICSQLLAATETACHRLSKAVMNELERRLLQRQQVSGFATFISAVILFSCIEKITAFYHSLDSSPTLGNVSDQSPNAATAFPNPDHRPAGYPPSVPPPSTLWPQGPHFARLLTTLLRMRALPPRTTRFGKNTLAVLQEPGLPVRLNGVAVREQQDENTARAASWLDALGLDVDGLRARRDGEISETGWEMRFVSGVLLSEGM